MWPCDMSEAFHSTQEDDSYLCLSTPEGMQKCLNVLIARNLSKVKQTLNTVQVRRESRERATVR